MPFSQPGMGQGTRVLQRDGCGPVTPMGSARDAGKGANEQGWDSAEIAWDCQADLIGQVSFWSHNFGKSPGCRAGGLLSDRDTGGKVRRCEEDAEGPAKGGLG